MATISQAEWKRYTTRLSKISKQAEEEFRKFVADNLGYGRIERQKLIDYAYALATKYGEASAALSAEMYDAVAELSGVVVPSAVPSEVTYQDVAKTVNGIIKKTASEQVLAQGVSRLVKMAGTDTILSNAYRDRPKGKGSKRKHSGAQVAWIPSGDTCPFCLMLASKGWQNQTEWGANNHSEHIHANCDCTYAVRFDNNLNVDGYDPLEYRKIYNDADGRTRDEKLKSMRDKYREENRDKINAQKRENYKENQIKEVFNNFKLSNTTSKGNSETVREVLGKINPSKTEEALAYFNNEIRNEPIEHAIVIEKSGNVIHFVGNIEDVDLYDVNLENAHVTHNHTMVTSFGESDYNTIKRNPSTTWHCVNPENEYKLKTLKPFEDVRYNDLYTEAMINHKQGEDLQDETMQVLAKRGYVKYDKKRFTN